MTAFLFSDANSTYTIAIGIVLAIAALEIIGQFIGLSLGQLIDGALDLDMDVSPDAGVLSGGLSSLLAWMGLNKVPFMVWLIIFLTSFALIGFTGNYLALTLISNPLPASLSAVIALMGGTYISHHLSTLIGRLIPKEQTSAVSKDSFSGMLAQITVGTARKGMPAEAVLKDEFDQKHYVLVEPIDEDEFTQGTKVVLVTKENNNWLVTRFD